MNLKQIKEALEQGKKVFWKSDIYQVIPDGKGDFNKVCLVNDHCIGLTWLDGITLNGEEKDFYCK